MVDVSSLKETNNRHDIIYPDMFDHLLLPFHTLKNCLSRVYLLNLWRVKVKVKRLNLNLKDPTDDEHFPNQQKLDDLIHDFGLPTPRLIKWNFLNNICRTRAARKTHERFSKYLSMKDDLCF